MSKVLTASCTAQVVTAGGIPLAGATVLSEGVAASSGIAIIDEDQVWYVPKGSPDLKSTLTYLIDVLTQLKTGIDKIGDTFTEVAAGMTGSTTAPPPTIAASVTTIKGTATAINTLKNSLTTLKGALK